MNQSFRILIATSSDDDALRLIRHLRRPGIALVFEYAATEQSLKLALTKRNWDLILCDHTSLQLNAIKVLEWLHRLDLDTPTTVVTGSTGVETIMQLMKAGGHDNFLKECLAFLDDASETATGDVRAHSGKHRKIAEAIHRMTQHDALTGLPNRVLFRDRLQEMLSIAERSSKSIAVLYLDLDNFKDVNDTLGHAVGDRLLQDVADRLRQCARDSDLVARLGGDEFAILATNLDEPDGAAAFAQRIVQALATPIYVDGHRVHASMSIGITLCPMDDSEPDRLLQNADLALYRAKDVGRGSYQFYDRQMSINVQNRQALEEDLSKGLECHEFALCYQPQIDLHRGDVVGAEVLLRWNHPEFGLVMPEKFIPLAERTGLVVPLGNWVLQAACAQLSMWRDAGLDPIRLAINITASQLKRPEFASTIDQLLEKNDLIADWIELELSESLMVRHVEAVRPTIEQLRASGIHLSIDEFGTGYSSLMYLKRFPVGQLKIHRSVVAGVMDSLDSKAVANAIIGLGKGLNLRVVAEGVERIEQLEFLHHAGCDEILGYYIGKPLPADEFSNWVSIWGRRQKTRGRITTVAPVDGSLLPPSSIIVRPTPVPETEVLLPVSRPPQPPD